MRGTLPLKKKEKDCEADLTLVTPLLLCWNAVLALLTCLSCLFPLKRRLDHKHCQVSGLTNNTVSTLKGGPQFGPLPKLTGL